MRVKKCLSILLTLVMVLSLLPTTALAADRGTVEVPYINDLGGEASADATPLTGSETELGTGFYAVTDNVTFNHPVTVTGSATRIILCDGKTAAFSSISVSTTGNCQLRFYGQEEGSGSLTATNLTGSLIYIYGGTISADTMTATPLNMFDGTLSADALTVGWYADFKMSSHFFGGIVDVDTLTVQDHDFTIGTENTPSPTDSFCAGSYVIAQGLKLHFANTFTAAEPDGNGAYIRYSGDYDNSAAAALNGKTLRPYITHTVNWVVEGETKETDTVLSGSPASYDGATPTKPDEQGKKYIFSGWSDGTNTYAPDALPPVTADVTYTAVFVAGHGIKVWYRYINPDMPNEPSSTVTPSVDVARAGETVTLTVNAAPKEKLTEQQSYSANSSSSVTLTNGFLAYSSSEIISIEKSGDSYSFVMPDAEVTIIAFFDYFNYSITVNEPIHGHMDVYKLNGNEMTAVTAADEGDEIHVRLAANPDDPYIVTGMTYTYTENGVNKTGEITLTNEINQLFLGTFTMPASDVVINITDQAAHRIRYESSALKQDYFSETTGQTVTLTPENGYTVTSVYVKCGDEYVTVTANADGTFSFMMPDGDVTVFTEFSYIDLDGSAKTSTPTLITGDMTDLNTGWYAVDGNITNNNRISVNGEVNLILCDGATLTAPKGISVNSGNSLTIWGQTAGSGALTAMIDENDEDLYYLAAIGGYQTSSGSITINGGTVTAKGGVMAAGIGGGREGNGTVIINGGTVTATGGNWGAGIGGGQRSDSNGGHGNVTINGGTVTTTGGAKSAGIGGGYNYDNNGTAGAMVVISGGVVNAIGGESGGVGIGGSADGSSISLGWTDLDDSITADSYSGTVTLTKAFTDGATVYKPGVIADNTEINGKTLTYSPTYTITVVNGENGAVTAPAVSVEGETVTLTVTPKEGYMLNTLTVKQGGTTVETAAGGNNTYTFTMPEGDVTVTATFKERVVHTVTIPEISHGTVTSDMTEAAEGEIVTLTVVPESGYALDELTMMDQVYPDEYAYATYTTPNGDGTFYFVMPEHNVVVKATFEPLHTVKIGSELLLAHGTISIDIGIRGGWNFEAFTSENVTSSGAERSMYEGQEAYIEFDPDPGFMMYKGYVAYLPEHGDRIYLDDGWVYTARGGAGGITAPENIGEYVIEINASFHFAPLAVNISDSIQNGSVAVEEIVRNGESNLYKQNADTTSSGPLYDFPTEMAAVGDTVKLNVTPEEGYVLDTLTVKDYFDSPVQVENNAFTMPDSGVQVTATFKEAKYGISTVFTDGTGSVNIGENDYRVTVGGDEPEENENGEYVAKPGDDVVLSFNTPAGYELVSVTGSYLDETQNECSLSITQDEEDPNRWSFTMPEGKTYLEVSFKHVYHISIGQNAHGTVTADKTKAEKGETVTVTPQPADGYTYSGVVYAKTDDPTEFEWAVLDEASGNYTFEMPAYDVTVSLSEITKKSYSLDLVVTPEADNVLSVYDDHAQWGYTVPVSYYSDSGYQVQKIYYKIEGDDTENALTEDLSGGYSFTMPMANVTIYAEIEAITYPVSVDFGAGHEEFVQDLFEGHDEYSVDGSVVTFRMPAFNRFNEHSTLSDAYNMITDYCNTNVTDPLDNNKRFMYQFGLKARRGYEGEEEFNREREGYYETPLNKDEPSTLYALWAEPAAATVTVTPPECGTVLTKDVYHSAGRFNPVPELTVSGNASIRDESFEFTNWLIENADDYQVGAKVTLTGENTYSGRLFLNTEWGYFLDSSTAEEAITVEGGTLVSCDTDGKVVISVPVEHSYDEDGICTGCGVQKTAAPEFKSKSLVLSGQIGVNFFMKLPEIEGVDYSNSYMTFSITGKGTTTARDNYDATFKDKSGNGYYGFTCYVNSIQMADTITATFHYGDDQTVSLDYSVADYIAYFDDHQNEYNQTTLDLIKAIADYGHYAQPFLSAENGWTIGTDYAEMTKHYTESFDLDSIKTAIDGYTFVKNIEGSGITKATYRLNLESETMVDVFLTVEDGTELTASATFNGKTFTAVKQADGRYRIRVSGISAHLLGETITITGTAGSDFTITVSALAYARAVLNSEAFGADAKNAMAALYRYYAAVKAYNS